ncbi:hypothetical protein EV426DRAFT_183083 [Tirmania nivea]|nr:hypothetical protein EV426DRAFT_183083 [Tirmania nivea]
MVYMFHWSLLFFLCSLSTISFPCGGFWDMVWLELLGVLFYQLSHKSKKEMDIMVCREQNLFTDRKNIDAKLSIGLFLKVRLFSLFLLFSCHISYFCQSRVVTLNFLGRLVQINISMRGGGRSGALPFST